MAGKGDIRAARRPREEQLFGLWQDGDGPNAGLDGYDSSQRAEILEVLLEGPDDGAIQIALIPDEEPRHGRR